MKVLGSGVAQSGLESLRAHSLLHRMGTERFDREQVAGILSQWYHPLHYFPTFLARHIALAPTIEAKTYVCKIMWQELGEGRPRRSHESIYIETMSSVGFTAAELVNARPLPATRSLVDAYADKSQGDYAASLGYLFATEAADLLMVSSVGNAVRQLSGATSLPWVDIHCEQEPDHTASVSRALSDGVLGRKDQSVTKAAEQMYDLWIDFFSGIEALVDRIGDRSQRRAAS